MRTPPKYLNDRQRIQEILNMDDLEYCTLQYETGLSYLRSFCLGLNGAYSKLERSSEFWLWWIYEWSVQDHMILNVLKWDSHKIQQSYGKHHLDSFFVDDLSRIALYPTASILKKALREGKSHV